MLVVLRWILILDFQAFYGAWHANIIQACPGLVQIPQLALQQTRPVGHCLSPHCSWSMTGQISLVHFSPGAVQYPQLSLQQTWPSLHCVGPHCSSTGRGVHNFLLQVSLGASIGEQVPQLSLQQYSEFPSQVFLPQGTIFGGGLIHWILGQISFFFIPS